MSKTKKRILRATIFLAASEVTVWLSTDSARVASLFSLALLFSWVFAIVHAIRKTYDICLTIEPKPVRPSALVSRYLEGLHGIEIGASTQNSYHLPRAINVDFSDNPGNWQKNGYRPAIVHLVSPGDDLPFKNGTLDFVLSSHNLEHYFDPIGALKEWWRVVRPGGYIILVIPHKERTFDRDKPDTSLTELIQRHQGKLTVRDYIYKRQTGSKENDEMGFESSATLHQIYPSDQEPPEGWARYEQDDHHHWSIWRTEGFLELCEYLNLPVMEYQDKDDKVGNGFTIVIQKPTDVVVQ